MTSTINASSTGSGGIVQTADASGVLALQANGTTAFTVNSDATTTFANAANLPNTFGFKNRIINGGMVIDQRNAGASVTPANGGFGVDRWKGILTQASKFSMQQSSVVPTGFVNSLLVTSLSAYSVLTGDAFDVEQPIEAFNVGDLGWGAAGAQTVTVSFWVRSSLTGAFGGALLNSAANYSYPFSYTINSANTWEQKTVTISGPTAGTWASGNNTGISVRFSLGCGSTYSGTAGAWSANTYIQPTGSTSVVGTNNATFYITGVQLEKGSAATSFDFRSYGTELALCQRYFCKSSSTNVVATNGAVYSTAGMFSSGAFNAYTLNAGYVQWIHFPVFMRTEPATITLVNTNLVASPTSGAWSIYNIGSGWVNGTGTAQSFTTSGFGLNMVGTWASGPSLWYGAWTASAEL